MPSEVPSCRLSFSCIGNVKGGDIGDIEVHKERV
jgi:hypothetical protein